MKKVIFGFIGNVLDQRGRGRRRWERWRPTISLCMQPDFAVARVELLYNPNDYHLACQVEKDLNDIAPLTEINLIEMAIEKAWDFEEVYTNLLDLAKNYHFNLDQEEYYLHITTGTHVMQICWFLLAEARFFPAKLLQTSPPETRVAQGEATACGSVTVIDLDLSRYDHIMTRFSQQTLQATTLLKSGIATKNAHFNQMIEEIESVASRSTAAILLEGPTGAGKSFLADRIYQLKLRQHQLSGKFVAVNCATLRGDSAMSTLFGHVKGAFTGAEKKRDGLLVLANGGLLFLDEIADLGLDEQAMLLKALEEKKFYPFGADEEVYSDFQLIAGTHKNLKQQVKQGLFREDLYARINLWRYCLPGLAQRREDIEPNLDYELARYAKERGQMLRFSRQARARYLNFATSAQALWRGNFRELNASVTRMGTLAIQGNVDIDLVESEINRLKRSWQDESESLSPLIPTQIDLFERAQLEQVLQVCQQANSLSEAGRRLFAYSREAKRSFNDADRLRKYLAKFNLNWEQLKGR